MTEERELGVRALGAVVWYLQRCLIDYQLLTMGQFAIYEPIDVVSTVSKSCNAIGDGRYMVNNDVSLRRI